MAKAVGEFSKDVIRICYASKIVKNWDVKLHEDVVARIRISLVDGSFIDIYHNVETEKISFAWIKDNKRVYGADNLDYWHTHPINDPRKHVKSEEIDFKEFLLYVEKAIKNRVK